MTREMEDATPVVVRLHYDLASSLCYVTHRVVARITPELEQIGVALEWTPIDLAALLNWRRGAVVPSDRIANVERVSRELDVPLRVPPRWLDSRAAMAIGLTAPAPERAATWRERFFTAVFEEGRDVEARDECLSLAREVDLEPDDADIESALDELERRTREASEAEVTGVPTFMLDRWPFGGIQDDQTMLNLLTRFVRKRAVHAH